MKFLDTFGGCYILSILLLTVDSLHPKEPFAAVDRLAAILLRKLFLSWISQPTDAICDNHHSKRPQIIVERTFWNTNKHVAEPNIAYRRAFYLS